MNRFLPALQAVYAGRAIDLTNLPALVRAAERQPGRPDELAADYAGLFAGDFDERAQQLQLLRQDRDVLALLERQHEAGEIDSFRYDGRRYHSADARRLLQWIDGRLDEEERWWADFDRRVFVVHYRMAFELGEAVAEDLRARYEFQLGLQDIERETSRRRRILSRVASFANEMDGPLEYGDFHEVRADLLESYDAFEKCLQTACRLRPPKLPGLPAGQPLANVLLTEVPVQRLKPVAQTVSGRWIKKFARQLDEVRANARRVRAESIGPLLARLAAVAERWAEEMTNLPEVEEVEAAPAPAAKPPVDLQPLDDEPEFELTEEDVVAGPAEEVEKADAELDEAPDAEEFALSDRDVLPEPGEAGPKVELEEIDPDDHRERPRHWNV